MDANVLITPIWNILKKYSEDTRRGRRAHVVGKSENTSRVLIVCRLQRFIFHCIKLAETAAQPDSETRSRARSLSQAHVDRLVHESYARVGRSRRYTLAQCCGVAAVIVVFVAAIVLRVVTEHIKV